MSSRTRRFLQNITQANNHQSNELLVLCAANPLETGGLPAEMGPVVWKVCPCYDDIIYSNLNHGPGLVLFQSLQLRYNQRVGVSNQQPQESTVTGLCAGNSPVTGEFPAQIASNAENVSI